MSRFRQALIGTASAMALLAGLSLGAGTAAAEEAQDADALASIALDPAAVPAPIARDHAAVVKVELETIEREALLADGTSFRFWTFNGTVGAITGDKAIKAHVGETMRIYFGVGGPNKTSSFHVIGEIFDKVYTHGSLTSPASEDVQTVSVAPGGATVVDLTFEVPGRYIVVDHALSRMERGLVAQIAVDGPADSTIFDTYGADLSMAGH